MRGWPRRSASRGAGRDGSQPRGGQREGQGQGGCQGCGHGKGRAPGRAPGRARAGHRPGRRTERRTGRWQLQRPQRHESHQHQHRHRHRHCHGHRHGHNPCQRQGHQHPPVDTKYCPRSKSTVVTDWHSRCWWESSTTSCLHRTLGSGTASYVVLLLELDSHQHTIDTRRVVRGVNKPNVELCVP